MKIGYKRGYADGKAQAAEHYERTVALLQEQLADLQVMSREQTQRADGAVDQLLQHVGLRGITTRAALEEDRLVQESRDVAAQVDVDLLDDHPFGTNGTVYANKDRVEEAVIAREIDDA